MPVIASDLFLGCLRVRTNSHSDSVSSDYIRLSNTSKRRHRPNLNAIPRPPPGMTRAELKQTAQEKLGMDVVNNYNFCVCGGSGGGKSSFINGILNREDVRPGVGRNHNMFGSAPIGEWQTTMEIRCYAYPQNHELGHVRIWDSPGLGTHEHPSAGYFEEKCLYAFDVLMIVVEKELSEYEYTLLENARKWETSTIIIVTKADEKVNAKLRQLNNPMNPPLEKYRKIVQEAFKEARERVHLCLDKKGLHQVPVFIISSWKYRDFMIEQERPDKLAQQQISAENLEAYANEPVSQQTSNPGVNNDILADDETQQQEIVGKYSLEKMIPFVCEMERLSEYIMSIAADRRL